MDKQSPPFSCDTLVALGSATASGQVIFGKNSDRPQEEAQPLVQRPRQLHEDAAGAGAQFIRVPQVRKTYRHIGSRPYWCSGYEHGFNEHQVVIGNEALPTKLPVSDEPKLIGMELVRLGLERGASAAEAVDVITGLVSSFGQGKFNNDAGVRTYDNSYIVADPKEAFIVEAVGHDWAVREVEKLASISNVCTLGEPTDRLSRSAQRRAEGAGLIEPNSSKRFSFSGTFADTRHSRSGITRQGRTEALLVQHAGRIEAKTVMRVLADHSDGADPTEPFVEDAAHRDRDSICVHRTGGTTAASLVADLSATPDRLPVFWCSMYSPCMTLFMPVFLEGDLPSALAIGGQIMSDDSPWWSFYRITHSGLAQGPERRSEIRSAWAPLQRELMESAYEMARNGRELTEGGKPGQANALLTGYMSENFHRAMEIAASLQRQVPVAGSPEGQG